MIRMRNKIVALFVGAIGVALLSVRVYGFLAPHVSSVPMLSAEQASVSIRGTGFGRQGEVVFLLPDGEAQVMRAISWTSRNVSVEKPAALARYDRVQIRRYLAGMLWPSNTVSFFVRASGLPSQPYGYGVPVQPDAPWPLFRRDEFNTGRSPIQAKYDGGKPWAFHTEKGVFSTPVIAADGTVFVGSADCCFYAIARNGSLKWRFRTNGIIDSAAAIHRSDAATPHGAVTFISGDGLMYHLNLDDAIADPSQRVLWTFDASCVPGAGYINWWEGNVALGPDGTLLAGNTNWNYYAVTPEGQFRWKYPTRSNNWSMAAFGTDGTIYWGALDTKVRAVRPEGHEKWSKRTWGMVAASAAIGSDGTIYIGSFDTYLYALDPDSGATKWSFKTGDHIYGSAALGVDETGRTNAVYIGSTDGILYALDPSGRLLWTFDSGDPIRSSPAIGRAPEGEQGWIVYFGSGNGILYALNAKDGSRRWSYDWTPETAEYRDRNDLNASPALGMTGVYIGGEHGNICYVPYDYPLHASDSRASVKPNEDIARDEKKLYYITPGGSTMASMPETIAAATILDYRLVVRENGRTLDARLNKKFIKIETRPAFPYTFELSADGHYLHLLPTSFLDAGAAYTVRVIGNYRTGGFHFGKLTLGGHKAGSFESEFHFTAASNDLPSTPLRIESDAVSAFELTRLAVPLPTMMPSLNQIGFDSFDWIVSPIRMTKPDAQGQSRVVLWMTGAERGPDGILRAAAKPECMFPLNGIWRGDQFILQNGRFEMKVQGVRLPFEKFEWRGQMRPDLTVKPDTAVYAEVRALSVPDYGPLLVLGGLANDLYKKLIMVGTYVTRPYDERGSANRRPSGVEVTSIDNRPSSGNQPGRFDAHIRCSAGTTYRADAHRPAIVLLDEDRTEGIVLDYLQNTTITADTDGNVAQVSLTIPPTLRLPIHTTAIVMLDAFPNK